jgi:hypothetical protein
MRFTWETHDSVLSAIQIEWDANRHKRVRRVARLDALLDRLDAEARELGRLLNVEIVRRGGAGALAIVLGGERSSVSHLPGDADPPHSISVGEQNENRPFTFYMYGDHHSEVRWRNTVPIAAAREAAREFLRSGRLDSRIRWEHT